MLEKVIIVVVVAVVVLAAGVGMFRYFTTIVICCDFTFIFGLIM